MSGTGKFYGKRGNDARSLTRVLNDFQGADHKAQARQPAEVTSHAKHATVSVGRSTWQRYILAVQLCFVC